jgi:hypothetical protein
MPCMTFSSRVLKFRAICTISACVCTATAYPNEMFCIKSKKLLDTNNKGGYINAEIQYP